MEWGSGGWRIVSRRVRGRILGLPTLTSAEPRHLAYKRSKIFYLPYRLYRLHGSHAKVPVQSPDLASDQEDRASGQSNPRPWPSRRLAIRRRICSIILLTGRAIFSRVSRYAGTAPNVPLIYRRHTVPMTACQVIPQYSPPIGPFEPSILPFHSLASIQIP